MGVEMVLPVVLVISIFSLGVAGLLAMQVLAADTGKPEMRAISGWRRASLMRRQWPDT